MIGLANLLGLLGLLGVIGLIIIYIIKPNYQQKFISSTYVWKLSLKYRKRKISTNKLMNLLLIICQVLILVSCALILAQPVIKAQEPEKIDERIIIIDASANMLATNGIDNKPDLEDGTRFLRAVRLTREMVADMFENDKNARVTIIIASDEAYMLQYKTNETTEAGAPIYNDINRLGLEYENIIDETLMTLSNSICTFGSADIEGAMSLCGPILDENENARVILYSATEYINDGKVEVMSDELRLETEWNAAILTGSFSLNEHYVYTFNIDVGLYGIDGDIEIVVDVMGANAAYNYESGGEDFEGVNVTYHLRTNETLLGSSVNGATATITLDTFTESEDWLSVSGEFYSNDGGEYDGIYSFKSVHVYICRVGDKGGNTIEDSLFYDNDFYFYDGIKPTIKVQYASDASNPFMKAILQSWVSALEAKWDVVTREVSKSSEPELEGYDLYIFERKAPAAMPIDGAVMLVAPQSVLPSDFGITISNIVGLTANDVTHGILAEHELVKNLVHANDYAVQKFTKLDEHDEDYEELIYLSYLVNGSEEQAPVAIVRNKPDHKVFAMGLDLNYSDLAMYSDMTLLYLNAFNYFFPTIIDRYVYEIGDAVEINSLGFSAEFSDGTSTKTIEEFPYTQDLDLTGKYTVSTRLMSGASIEASFYVKMPAIESNILREEPELTNPYHVKNEGKVDKDLLIYFAATLVALLFAEWFLHSRNQF